MSWNGWPGESNGDPKPKSNGSIALDECPLCKEPLEGTLTNHIRYHCTAKQYAAGGELAADGGRR